jgi:hypothetical protein
MIIFGSRSSERTPVETGCNCTACNAEKSIYLLPYQKYAHVFWIPVFPTGRDYRAVCGNCKALFDANSLDIPYEVFSQVKTPKWTFFGLFAFVIFLVLFMTLGAYTSNKYKKETVLYLESPMVNDIYEVKFDEKEYSLMKVLNVSGDSVYFFHHTHYVERKSDLKKLSKTSTYDDTETDAYSKSELMEMYSDGVISRIIR